MKHRSFVLLLALCLSHGGLFAQRLYLSGTGSDDTKQWDFRCSKGQNAGRWTKIAVPSCWELQGFGEYTYGRFYKTEGLKASDETGTYRTSFALPKAWRGKALRLTFEGVMTDADVRIDGQQVGEVHQGGFTEFAYNITHLVTPGKRHTLEVVVSKESANASVNSAERRADWWLFGGIYRPVHIDALPMRHMENLTINATADGDVAIAADIVDDSDGTTMHTEGEGIELTLDGQHIAYDDATHRFHCGNVSTWDPEHPNLHTAVVTLTQSGHVLTRRIGFRTLEFREHDGIYLNGTRLVVKGINRHSFHPETGRTTSKRISLEDARLIKRMNMNAVRCHYPSDNHFLDVCDSLGLLYIDELPGWQTRYDDATAQRLLPEFMMRDVNHPCVFLWSNGNEGGWNTSVDGLFARLDPQHRKVIHPWSDYDGIDTHHYPAYQTGAYRMHNGQNVFMPTEFLHSKYDKGGGAALEDMWAHWVQSPLFAGGFIWAYMDEAVRRTDIPMGASKGKRFGQKGFSIKDCLLDSDGGNGPDGVINCDRQPEGSFYAIREVWSPIRIEMPNITPSFDGRILVHNRYLFSPLSECRMAYRTRMADGSLVKEGGVVLPDINPGESAFATMRVPTDFRQADILELVAYDRNDEEVCSWSMPIHRAEEQLAIDMTKARLLSASEAPEVMPVGMSQMDDVRWYRLPDGRLLLDTHILYDERKAYLTDESKWTVGLSMRYPETEVDSVRWLGRGPFRVWRNRLAGQQFATWSLAYNNTVTGQYNTPQPPLYPEFKGYRSDMRWLEIYHGGDVKLRVTSLTEGLYFRLFTPEEAVDQTPGEMGGMDEGKRKQERTMVKFPDGDISFLLSIPPMQSYKPLEQLGPSAQPDNIRIKPGDEGFHIRLIVER